MITVVDMRNRQSFIRKPTAIEIDELEERARQHAIKMVAYDLARPRTVALAELEKLDIQLPRCVEDVFDAIGWDKANPFVSAKHSRKEELRRIVRGE